jgi:hypothetical protein
MKAYKYKRVEKLNPKAVVVSTFAKDNDMTVGYVYMKYKRGKADYEIVNYQGVNFIVPASVAKTA